MPDRRSVIVTFKKKDQRSTDADKTQVLGEALSSQVSFLSADDFARGPSPVLASLPRESVGYDVNRYGAPILVAQLTDQEIDRLRNNDDIVTVEDDGEMHALQEFDFQIEDAPAPLAQTVPVGVNHIKAPAGWGASQGLAIKVFILDTGIDSDHPDLVDNLHPGRSFVPDEETTEDYQGHGTHCAGTVAASFNGQGVVGVAPYAYLHPVKVLSASGSGNWSWLIAGLDWVSRKKGLRIASMSLGGSAPSAVKTMCDDVYDDGVLLVAAAGNSGPGDNTVGDPARFDSVMAVSAIDSANVIATFSSRGPEVEITAPGVNVLSTLRGGGYGHMSGTSMACPHVAGAAAMAWGAHRSLNNKQIRRLLQVTADKLGVPGKNPLHGWGRVDAQQAAVWLRGIDEATGP